jgi:hypothetical protein
MTLNAIATLDTPAMNNARNHETAEPAEIVSRGQALG